MRGKQVKFFIKYLYRSLNFPKPSRPGTMDMGSNAGKRIVAEEIIEELPSASKVLKTSDCEAKRITLTPKIVPSASKQSLKSRQQELVVVKKSSSVTKTLTTPTTSTSASTTMPSSPKIKTNGLSMVAMYSDSSDSTGSNEDK